MLAVSVALVVIVVLLMLEVPVAFVFGLASFIIVILTGRDIEFLIPYAYQQESSFALLALPLFVIAGSLMGASGISDQLVRFVNSFVGSIKGGLGAVTIVTCALFGAIAGSGSSAIAAIGSMMIPRMVEAGYPRSYAISLVACSSVLAILIPPSVAMILFAITSGLSVAACFLSTIIPGVLIMAIYVVMNIFQARGFKDLEVEPKVTFPERLGKIGRATKGAFWALLMPGIMLGGIYGGIFTPTEAAAVALIYTLPVGFLIYKGLNMRTTTDAFVEGARNTGAIMMMLFFLFIMSRAMVQENIPRDIAEFMLSLSDNKIVILLMINALLLMLGMLVDDTAGAVLAAIVLLPVTNEIGIHPIHFAAIVGTNLGLGNVTPPCAPLLFMSGAIGGQTIDQYIKPTLKFMLIGHLPVVLLVTYIPDIALYLPRVLMGVQ
ncbi:Sialic acid TRAP transporter permease protein SiaT [Pelagimonas phthalicica]|uniref:TRAP transporter large permease protein n=1 Tax=Pelagimonas phthalicica TaxID=1037362 RepID=A0A238J7G3_9RHOB|nr:TRAP transporter large permease [Pelagimonas phthalicica]TDS94863.1 tripartite ATP-independent transporter DctM subunit [Pelagimonas phthalicica]SMX26608.1 Sialic acid TRAP transporter permease protein SiaT [Pelagimonas phthalicica]